MATSNPQPKTNTSPNSDSAEKSASVAPAAAAPAPLITLALSDPNALSNVQRRIGQITSMRGRSSLTIPLSSAQGVSGGIAIPR